MSQKKIPALAADPCVADRRENGGGEKQIPVAIERRSGKTRRAERGERRHKIDPATCARDYNNDEIQFMTAMDHYKRDNRRQFPTWSEVLEVVAALGYRKVAEPTPMPGLSTAVAPKVEA
jgi:hypothetical protein